jgi:hypothetical protein
MLELYRGIIDIFVIHHQSVAGDLRKHIRSFNDGKTEENNFGVRGFWNLLLEITLRIFVAIYSFAGTILIVSLAIAFFPLHAMMIATINILNHRGTPFPPEMIDNKQGK